MNPTTGLSGLLSGQEGAQTRKVLTIIAGGALIAYAATRRSPMGLAAAGTGGLLLYRSLARSESAPESVVHSAASVTIAAPVDTVCNALREQELLSRVFENFRSIRLSRQGDDWQLHGRFLKLRFRGELWRDDPPQCIGWRAYTTEETLFTGSVQLKPAPGDRGTELHASMNYSGKGMIARAAAKMLGPDILREGLRRFKQELETGEIPVATANYRDLQARQSQPGFRADWQPQSL